MGDDNDTNAMCSRHKFVVNWPAVPYLGNFELSGEGSESNGSETLFLT